MIMIISLFSFLFLKHRVYSNCDVKSSRSSHVFRRHVSWLSWNPHLNSRSVVIVWSREGFLISLIQLFPSPRLQGHSIFNALPFHSPLSTLHSRFRFLFSFLENILTLWPNQRLRPWEPFSHCRPENFSRSLTMSARRPDITRTPRSSNLIFIQRSVEFSHLIGSAFSNISLNITGNPSFLIRCLTIMIGIYLDGGWKVEICGTKWRLDHVLEIVVEYEQFETFGICLLFIGLIILVD